jgi:hypothetical protein
MTTRQSRFRTRHGLPRIYWPTKGATAYEFQIGRRWFRIVHLRGGFWALMRWAERFSTSIDKRPEYDD